ncbi:hypothetical protein ACA910_018611 [Epithemia clementina (nom. ined.)]
MSSTLHKIIVSAHDQISRIDELERKVDERCIRLRRRTCNILDSSLTAPYRLSHLRCFATHAYYPNGISNDEAHQADASITAGDSSKTDEKSTADAAAAASILTTGRPENSNNTWVLRLEGKLLIGHLDHASAKAHDQKVGYVAPADDLDRSKGEKEEDEVIPFQFTHFFERVEVEFQTTYSPRPHPMAKKKSPPASKKRRTGNSCSSSTSTKQSLLEENFVDPKLLVVSPTTTLVWTQTTAATADAHAFDYHYDSPPPVEKFRYQIHSVVARVQLFSNQQQAANKDPLYELSPSLAKELFPMHAVAVAAESAESHANNTTTTAGTASNSNNDLSKKRKAEDGSPGAFSSPGKSNSSSVVPPVENEVHIPDGLTMRQIAMAFFTYIHDHQLCDESDRGTIICDERLQNLFQLERFNFSGLQQLLLSNNLVKPMSGNPVKLTYIMKEDTATTYCPPPPPLGSKGDDDVFEPLQFQFDMDVMVPSLFPFRSREILRRMKRRELEYTSSRTKARYLLMARRAKEEEDVKMMIDQVVSGHQLGSEYIPIFTALAKAAPPHTEARRAAQCDAKVSFLMAKIQEHVAAATNAWKNVAAAIPSTTTQNHI